jgi:hypothetical protein
VGRFAVIIDGPSRNSIFHRKSKIFLSLPRRMRDNLTCLISRDGCRVVAQQDLRLIQEELTKEQKKSLGDQKINLRRTWIVRAVA